MIDAESFKAMFLPLGRMMFAEAMRILGDAGEAEDAVQDVYVMLWERRGELDAVVNHRAYAMAAVRNRCLTLSGAAGRRSLGLTEAESVRDTSDSLETSDRVGKIMDLIAALPDKQRLVITMHDIEGCPKREIESSTGLSADNVRQLLSRARRFIRSHFSKD